MNNVARRDAGLPYRYDSEALKQQMATRRLLQQFNTTDRCDSKMLAAIIQELFGQSEDPCVIPPFYCDYGFNIRVGKNFFANFNCTILDTAPVTIGDNCFMAPNVAIYTAGHPVHPDLRNDGWEYAKPIVIGDNVWLGGNVVVCPGVSIGSNVVIGAGSVVTHDIPDWVIAAGNPCQVLRPITDEDRQYYFRREAFDAEARSLMQSNK